MSPRPSISGEEDMVTLGWVAVALMMLAITVGFFKDSWGWIIVGAAVALGVFVGMQLEVFTK
jgi:hypothetical protein